MKINELIGALGVFVLLLAFFLNLMKWVSQDSAVYLWMNLIGAGLSCYASWLIPFWPFVVLEGTWGVVSAWGLLRKMMRG